jgi:hypothetical protein
VCDYVVKGFFVPQNGNGTVIAVVVIVILYTTRIILRYEDLYVTWKRAGEIM